MHAAAPRPAQYAGYGSGRRAGATTSEPSVGKPIEATFKISGMSRAMSPTALPCLNSWKLSAT